MDASHEPSKSSGIVLRRIPPKATEVSALLPEGFVPLRLHMEPGNMCVELAQPEVLLGRHSTADVRVPLPDVSRRHCRFRFSDGNWEVVDLDSLNGVYVNDERLRESVLQRGDTIRIAGMTFLVDLPVPQGSRTDSEDDGGEAVLRKIADVLPMRKTEKVTDQMRKAG